MSTPFEIADRLTEDYSDLHPIRATEHGVAGRDHLPTDYSPEGAEARIDLFRTARRALGAHLGHPDPAQAFAAEVIVGWLDTRLAEADARKWSWDINHIYSPFQDMRDVFDVMDKESKDDWSPIVARLNAFPSMLEGYKRSLGVGLSDGLVSARRQAESVLQQVEEVAAFENRFSGFPQEAESTGADGAVVERAVATAREACDGFAGWLRDHYLPATVEPDGVGIDRYRIGADTYLGMSLDLDETYEWGWSEVHRIQAEMESTADEIDSRLGLAGVIEMLENDPSRAASTRQEFIDFVQGIQDQAIDQLDGPHFDVPAPIRRVTVNVAPPGGALGAWYMGPSEDFSRPGSIWYAPGEREALPLWSEVTTAYHEGFPGHHLQVGIAQLQDEKLSRFHRMYIWYSGSGEGWALYAERLMDELGYFEKPEYRLGLLASQLFRATRVVVDIGCHLSLGIPDQAPRHRGEPWSYDRAVDYMEKIALIPRDVAESEVKRYLGWWGQAISYKVGEREILSIREDAKREAGAAFDRKDFHSRMLHAGAIRLDHLRSVMLG